MHHRLYLLTKCLFVYLKILIKRSIAKSVLQEGKPHVLKEHFWRLFQLFFYKLLVIDSYYLKKLLGLASSAVKSVKKKVSKVTSFFAFVNIDQCDI